MIRAVGNKRLFLTDAEFSVYNKIADNVGKESFNETFDSNKNGIILSVISAFDSDPIVTQFLFNIMINQRTRELSKALGVIDSLAKRVEKLESKINSENL